MTSYWFVYHVVRYTNRDGDFCEIKGNSAHKLPTQSFLPGTVRKSIEGGYLGQMSHKLPEGQTIEVAIESFGAIEKEGYDDFINRGLPIIDNEYSLSGREFITSKKVVVTTTHSWPISRL
jgi:hypothetical protein